MKCLICNEYENDNKKTFSVHLQMRHKITSEDYTIKYILKGERPLCPICNSETRYVSYTFKKYCKEHSNYSESEAGKNGGRIKKTWNKGKTKNDDERLMEYSKRYTKEGNPFWGKKHSPESIEKANLKKYLKEGKIEERLALREDEFEIFFNYENYKSRGKQYIDIKCKKCGYEHKRTLRNLEMGSRCPKCFPTNISSSQEIEIEKFLKDLGFDNIERNTRKIISPKELDLYLPEQKLAIEYNGLYWHEEKSIGKNSHLWKTKKCLEQNINLFHIFGDEWEEKKEIIKSMLKHKLNIQERRIFARNCEVKFIENDLAKSFYIENHISGKGSSSKISFGIFFNEELVGCLTLKVPFKRNNYKIIEISRFCTKINISVIGGFGKILKRVIEWSKDNNFDTITTYADRRFGEGKVYEKCGFDLIGSTKEDYWYTDGRKRYFRTKFKASKGKMEKEIALENKVFRIYGCGSNIYQLKIN